MSDDRPLNAMTVDVEEYFQVSAFEDAIGRDRWAMIQPRVRIGVDVLLQLFAKHDVKATFFVLGWIAERDPALVHDIHAAGHEIASHGYAHRLVTSFDTEGFRADLRRAAEAIHAACGADVAGFRAPSFSFSEATPWAHDVLREEGYRYSSSVFPVRHDRYGMPDFSRHPVRLEGDGDLWEFPMTTWRVLGRNLPAAGGGWLRAFPLWVTARAIATMNAAGWPAIVYVHPWELDPAQPVVGAASRRARFRHRLNLHRTRDRLDALLGRFAFAPALDVLARLES